MKDNRIIEYIMPVRIKAAEGGIVNVLSLLREKPPQIGLNETEYAETDGGGYLILDFGRELSGGVRILTYRAEGDAQVRLRFGESLSETCSEPKGLQEGATATNDHSLRDFYIKLVSLSDMRFGNTGFRFVRLDFPAGSKIKIKNIFAAFEHRDLKRSGRFECSDPAVNRIFDTAAYTVELCMQGMLWDGIKRDRLVWIGDMHPETLAVISLFGADPCIEQALSFVRGETPLPAFMNNIPSYSFWWPAIIADYYLHNGNIVFLERERDYITSLVSLIDALVEKDGSMRLPRYFLDWPTADAEGRAGTYALCAYAMEKAKVIYRALGEDESVLDGIAGRIDRSLRGGDFKQVTAMRVFAGFDSAEDVVGRLLLHGAHGMSTFMSYYILSSVAMAGRTKDALQMMRDYYGGMLERGATTFWEDFDLSWLEGSGRIDEFPKKGQKDLHGDFGAYCYKGFRHSLCHGWSGGPVPFLMHYVLGIREAAAGCKKMLFAPDLCGLKWARGTYPVPQGNVEISLTETRSGVKAEINAPAGIEIVRRKVRQ